jgi:nitric-oxide synthase
MDSGRIIGDPASIEFTNLCIKYGWKPKYGTYDILPLVIQLDSKTPLLFEIPSHDVLEVNLEHPRYSWFKDLDLKWYAVPIISNMALEIGGIVYKAAPFNGWYMSTEIAARNLSDQNRYNQLPKIAEKLGLQTQQNRNLWKDHALLALNEAVLNSFEKAGVKIIDQHTASEQFMQFSKIEKDKGRSVTGDWSWLVPPLASSASPIFHQEWNNKVVGPNFYYQKNDWDQQRKKTAVCPFHIDSLK